MLSREHYKLTVHETTRESDTPRTTLTFPGGPGSGGQNIYMYINT